MNQKKHSNKAVPFGDLELKLINESPRQWAKRLETCKSLNEFNMLILALNRHATYKEIRYFLDICNYFDQKKDKINKEVQGYMHKWKDKLRHREPRVFSAKSDYTKTVHIGLNHWLIYYQYQTRQSENPHTPLKRPTVIGVPGNGGMLMTPTSCFLAGLSESKRDLIIVRRCRKESYFQHNFALLEEICNNLVSILGSSLSQTMAFGTSAGGLAAICLGTIIGLDFSVGIAPGINKESINHIKKNFYDHHIYPKQFKKTRTKIALYAASGNKQDVRSVNKIRKALTRKVFGFLTCKVYILNNITHHLIFEGLADQGITIAETLDLLLCSTPEEKTISNKLIINSTTRNILEKLIRGFKPY